MSRPREEDGRKNLIAEKLIKLRKQKKLSQRNLAIELQRVGVDMDKNVITRIETNKRFVTDIELRAITKFFDVSYEYLIDDCVSETDEFQVDSDDAENDL